MYTFGNVAAAQFMQVKAGSPAKLPSCRCKLPPVFTHKIFTPGTCTVIGRSSVTPFDRRFTASREVDVSPNKMSSDTVPGVCVVENKPKEDKSATPLLHAQLIHETPGNPAKLPWVKESEPEESKLRVCTFGKEIVIAVICDNAFPRRSTDVIELKPLRASIEKVPGAPINMPRFAKRASPKLLQFMHVIDGKPAKLPEYTRSEPVESMLKAVRADRVVYMGASSCRLF
jgi:hypothetical protein